MPDKFSYKKAGVNIDIADAAKRAMAKSLEPTDPNVLNRLGAFAALYDAKFPGYENPVLVLKMEEPGSKQKLAFRHGRVASICYDLINHLVDDIIVMGATPLYVQDCIICGKIQPEVVKELVASMADHVLWVPDCPWMLSPVVTVIPLQILAYQIATLRGLDVDQPRNLAKSVTVE